MRFARPPKPTTYFPATSRSPPPFPNIPIPRRPRKNRPRTRAGGFPPVSYVSNWLALLTIPLMAARTPRKSMAFCPISRP